MPGSLFCFMAGILEYECLEDGEMISFILNFISSTGNQHNVDLLATHLKFQICNCDIPYIFQADTLGILNFALLCLFKCTVLDGGMKVMTTLADSCQCGYQSK